MKDEMKRHFQLWYASEVEKQLKSGTPINLVTVDVAAAAVKVKSANWIISSWSTLTSRPNVAVNGLAMQEYLMLLILLFD